MPFKQLTYKKFDDDEAFYVENHADYVGDELDSHPAIRELQVPSKSRILNAVRQPYSNQGCACRPTETHGRRRRTRSISQQLSCRIRSYPAVCSLPRGSSAFSKNAAKN